MRQLQLVEPRRLEWVDAPDPVLDSERAALVRPLAVANCDLDAMLVPGLVPVPTPYPFGHECTATVVAVGDGVRSVAPGAVVVVPFQISCGECDRCRAGLTGSCRTAGAGASYGMGALGRGAHWGGALSDLLLVPYADAMLVPVPDGVDPVAIPSAADNVPDAYRTVAPGLARHPGAEVLVVGGRVRSIGLYTVLAAQALGASRVVYLDPDASRLEAARALGAEVVEGPYPRKAGSFPITVDCSVDAAGLACAARSTAPGGTCTSPSIYFGETPLPLLEMYTTGMSFVTGRVNARAELDAVLRLQAAGTLGMERVTVRTVPWDDAPLAFADLPVKLVVARDA